MTVWQRSGLLLAKQLCGQRKKDVVGDTSDWARGYRRALAEVQASIDKRLAELDVAEREREKKMLERAINSTEKLTV